MKKEVLIIIPAYNEEASLGIFLDKLLASEVIDFSDILVINDASRDATAKIARNKNVMVIDHPYNLGYGTALQTGYKYAVWHNYRYVIQIDGDGQHDICNITKIYELLHDTSANDAPDLIIGSRFLEGSQSFHVSFLKKIAISFFRKFIKLTSKQTITDPTSGLQGLTYPIFSYYATYGNFDNNYPDANMIVQMALLGFRMQEFPAVMHEREAGQSMHFGIIKPILYMFIMIFSTLNAYLRNKCNLYPMPNKTKGGTDIEEK